MTDQATLDAYRARLERAALQGWQGRALYVAAAHMTQRAGSLNEIMPTGPRFVAESLPTSMPLDTAPGTGNDGNMTREDRVTCTASVQDPVLPQLAARRCVLGRHKGPHQDAAGVPFREEK